MFTRRRGHPDGPYTLSPSAHPPSSTSYMSIPPQSPQSPPETVSVCLEPGKEQLGPDLFSYRSPFSLNSTNIEDHRFVLIFLTGALWSVALRLLFESSPSVGCSSCGKLFKRNFYFHSLSSAPFVFLNSDR